ncbi:MAG: helix-turn-helix domain-containing protein [Acidobacteria bacterium]|nr:helix-turn-helix domain-containing protein [Acidobacteriota bacterium]
MNKLNESKNNLADALSEALRNYVDAEIVQRLGEIEIRPRDPREIVPTKVYRYVEAAKACQMSRDTLARAVKSNDLKIHYKGATPYFPGSDLLMWLERDN